MMYFRCLLLFFLMITSSCHTKRKKYSFSDTYFITYGDDRFKESRQRIAEEARSTGAFEDVFVYSPENLKEFTAQHNEFRMNNKRGGGYWLWKPYTVKQTFEKVEDGAIVIYTDSGSTLRTENMGYLSRIIELLKSTSIDAYVYQFSDNGFMENCFTKMDTAKEFGLNKDSKEMLSNQIHATYFILKKTKQTEKLIDDWIYFAIKDDYSLLTDKPSQASNHKCFYDHRHDQSIFSLLNKLRDTTKAVPDNHVFFDPTRIRK